MATDKDPFDYNLDGLYGPLRGRGSFQAGATQAISRGEILELTGDTNTKWVPIDSDFAMNSNVCVADDPIASGDLAGYYSIFIPRPTDVFQFDLATADNPSWAAALYYSASQTVTTSAGSNVLGRVAAFNTYPDQGFAHLGDPDAGTTIATVNQVQMVFEADASYWSALFSAIA